MLNSLAVDLSDARHHNKKKKERAAHTHRYSIQKKVIKNAYAVIWWYCDFCPMTLYSMFRERISWKSVRQKNEVVDQISYFGFSLYFLSLPFAYICFFLRCPRWAFHSVAFAYRLFCYPLIFCCCCCLLLYIYIFSSSSFLRRENKCVCLLLFSCLFLQGGLYFLYFCRFVFQFGEHRIHWDFPLYLFFRFIYTYAHKINNFILNSSKCGSIHIRIYYLYIFKFIHSYLTRFFVYHCLRCVL